MVSILYTFEYKGIWIFFVGAKGIVIINILMNE